jgi:hypothetical protein
MASEQRAPDRPHRAHTSRYVEEHGGVGDGRTPRERSEEVAVGDPALARKRFGEHCEPHLGRRRHPPGPPVAPIEMNDRNVEQRVPPTRGNRPSPPICRRSSVHASMTAPQAPLSPRARSGRAAECLEADRLQGCVQPWRFAAQLRGVNQPICDARARGRRSSKLPVVLRPPPKGPLRPPESRVLLAAAIGIGVLPSYPADWDPRVVMALWPRTVAHVVAGSLGYATPTVAARIVADARARRPNWCEWIDACHGRDAHAAVLFCVRGRHHHRGPMAEYDRALALVREANASGREPLLASWF